MQKYLFPVLLVFSGSVWSADILQSNSISCISGDSNVLGRRISASASAEKTLVEWQMKEQFGDSQSTINFTWTPKEEGGPSITIDTTDKPHNSIAIRSRTKSSLIVVSSTSNFYSSESWTFALNFSLENMIATRVVSNNNGLGSEQIAYQCRYATLKR